MIVIWFIISSWSSHDNCSVAVYFYARRMSLYGYDCFVFIVAAILNGFGRTVTAVTDVIASCVLFIIAIFLLMLLSSIFIVLNSVLHW